MNTAELNANPYKNCTPQEVRALVRAQKITGQTSGMCAGYSQANLCVLPKEYAYDFLLFCQRNPKSCPLLEVSDEGSRILKTSAPGADIATEIPHMERRRARLRNAGCFGILAEQSGKLYYRMQLQF